MRITLHEALLSEDDTGGFGSGVGMSPYGFQYTTPDMLYKAFIKPFTDVPKVASGKTKELAVAAQTLTKTVLTAAATSLIPFLNKKYEQIFKDNEKAVSKIRQEYGDVYQATWDAFKDADILTMAFMYDPGAVLTTGLAKQSLKTTGKMLSVLSGGALDDYLRKVQSRFGSGKNTNKGSWNEPLSLPETQIHLRDQPTEQITEDEAQQNDQKKPADYLLNKKVIAKAINSPKAQKMQHEAGQAVRGMLSRLYELANSIQQAQSLQDLQSKMGTHIDGLDKLQQIPQQDRAAEEKMILDTVKKSMASYFTTNLKKTIASAEKAGIPKNSRFIQDFQTALQKLS